MKQVELVKLKEIAASHRVCWLDQDVAPGAIISLKDKPHEKWAVKQVWDVEKEKVEINRTWHVGGL